MNTGVESDHEPDSHDRDSDNSKGKDADWATKRTEAPRSDSGETGIDPDAPGNFVDDTTSDSVPEPNEPA